MQGVVTVGSDAWLGVILLASFATKCKRNGNADGYSAADANSHIVHGYAHRRSDANADTDAYRQCLGE